MYCYTLDRELAVCMTQCRSNSPAAPQTQETAATASFPPSTSSVPTFSSQAFVLLMLRMACVRQISSAASQAESMRAPGTFPFMEGSHFANELQTAGTVTLHVLEPPPWVLSSRRRGSISFLDR